MPPQKCIDWNREVLKQELGLTEQAIVDIPQLFKLQDDLQGRLKAEAYFPNMVRRGALAGLAFASGLKSGPPGVGPGGLAVCSGLAWPCAAPRAALGVSQP